MEFLVLLRAITAEGDPAKILIETDIDRVALSKVSSCSVRDVESSRNKLQGTTHLLRQAQWTLKRGTITSSAAIVARRIP